MTLFIQRDAKVKKKNNNNNKKRKRKKKKEKKRKKDRNKVVFVHAREDPTISPDMTLFIQRDAKV